jgi:hypothetical protein
MVRHLPYGRLGVLLLALAAPLLGASGAAAAITPIHPRSAAAFQNSVGVNVHLSYYNTAYRNFPAVAHALADLGVRQVRDGACAGCTGQNDRLEALGRQGIGLTLIMGHPGGSESLASLVSLASGPLLPHLAAVEGPNEYDGSGDRRWTTRLRAYQHELWRRVRATPKLTAVPVLGPSLLSFANFSKLGDLSHWLDCGNVHPYAAGDVPSADLRANMAAVRRVASRKPVCATEAGYHNATADRGDHPGVSETTAGAYVPRLYLDFFRAGIERTFLYELVDEWSDPGREKRDSNFGLLRNDFSPKPAYRSLKALMQLTAPSRRVGRLARLRIAVKGPTDVRWQLLQTAPGRYAIVLWREVRVWDQNRLASLRVSARRATVTLGPHVSMSGVVQADGRGQSRARASALHGGRQLGVQVGAHPVVMRLETR